MGTDRHTDTEANTIVRPYTFYYYYCNLIKEGRTKKEGKKAKGRGRLFSLKNFDSPLENASQIAFEGK
jgi:hypothetical protein